jgi:hypothetical protein
MMPPSTRSGGREGGLHGGSQDPIPLAVEVDPVPFEDVVARAAVRVEHRRDDIDEMEARIGRAVLPYEAVTFR